MTITSKQSGSSRCTSSTPIKVRKDHTYETENDDLLDMAQVIKLDWDNPFPGENLFVFRVDGVPNAAKTEVSDHIQVHLTGIVDKTDVKKYKAHLLGNGQGMVLEVPVLPHFVYAGFGRLQYHDDCDISFTKYSEILAAIKSTESNKTRHIILEFPDDIQCTAELWESEKDNKLPGGELQIRCGMITCEEELGNRTFNEIHMGAKWTVRIKEGQRSLESKTYDDNDKWTKAFQGMTF